MGEYIVKERERTHCPLCNKHRIFIKSIFPEGFIVCTHCRYRMDETK